MTSPPFPPLFRRSLVLLVAAWLAVSATSAARGQGPAPPMELVGPPTAGGSPPVLFVAPDGMVHLDGPMAGQGGPYPQAYGMQPMAPPSGDSPLWRPFPKDWQGLTGAAPSPTGAPGNGPAPHWMHRHGIWGEFWYIRPRDADVAFATPTDGAANPVPIGPTASFDPDFEPNFRAGFNVRLSDCVSLATQYGYLRTDTETGASISAASGELLPLLMHPGTINALSNVQDATGTLKIEQDLLDVDLKGLFTGTDHPCQNCADQVNYIAGVRFARFDQQLGVVYAVTGTTTVNSAIDFEGAGPRFGIEATRHSNAFGVFAYGRAVGSVLVGEFDAQVEQRNTFNGLEAFSSWSSGRVVPVLDLELGLGWTGPQRRLRISGGYLVSAWWNVVTLDDYIEATQTFQYQDLSGVMTFDGLVARAEWLF